MKHTEHEILSHGYMISDYFQGCGTHGSKFPEVYTGSGSNEREAYEDACEQAYLNHENISLPTRPRGINAKNKVPANLEEVYWYVSIRLNP